MKKIEEIRILLDKYWNCQTTIEEEKILQLFFSQNNLPKEFEPYVSYFRYVDQLQNESTNADFDEKIETAINRQNKEKDYITLKIFLPALRAVASIAIILSLSFGVYFIINKNSKSYFAETYNDPNAAFEHATFALGKLSEALQKGEQASMKSIQELQKVDVDWTALDSLSEIGSNDNSVNNNTPLENDL
jgi:hypothetical protein